jgi:hypothetical protein
VLKVKAIAKNIMIDTTGFSNGFFTKNISRNKIPTTAIGLWMLNAIKQNNRYIKMSFLSNF